MEDRAALGQGQGLELGLGLRQNHNNEKPWAHLSQPTRHFLSPAKVYIWAGQRKKKKKSRTIEKGNTVWGFPW